MVWIKLDSTTFGPALLSPALIQFILNSSRNGMRPSALRMTCHASRFGGLSSIDYSRGRDDRMSGARINIDRNEGLPDGQFGVWEDGA